MSEIKVVPLPPEHKGTWNSFVEASNNGTMFHRLDFLDYHPPERFRFQHLMFFQGDRLVAVLPGASTGETYKSPAGASFGGFVVKPDIGLREADGIIKAFLRYCASNLIKEVYLTPPMQVYSKVFNESVEYAMHYNHFVQISALFSSVADLDAVNGKDSLSTKVRYNINKGLRSGVVVEESKEFDLFYPILVQNKSKFDTKPAHTSAELKRIDSLLPDGIRLFLAFFEGKPIAGELLFITNSACVLNFYTMHLYDYRSLHPVNILVEHAMRWCHAKGFKYFDYGVSADTFSIDPMEPSWTLIEFKESMGFRGCQRKTYYRRIF